MTAIPFHPRISVHSSRRRYSPTNTDPTHRLTAIPLLPIRAFPFRYHPFTSPPLLPVQFLSRPVHTRTWLTLPSQPVLPLRSGPAPSLTSRSPPLLPRCDSPYPSPTSNDAPRLCSQDFPIQATPFHSSRRLCCPSKTLLSSAVPTATVLSRTRRSISANAANPLRPIQDRLCQSSLFPTTTATPFLAARTSPSPRRA